ncbi:ADP-ribose pyrophosphatase [Intrasporangium oryzae NRRL B-24470]|uniref:ADP-ribose pyrophosphatase n=1 Tax=Intrasporangium oryzae NRRL B-24470 TaxID=1386089 RepID=W9GCM4_9MICO|nr:NUDIX hydrolase [Intrasporangium oryzae]EWT02972.1 ADP-ribose pyrophosphatase [Intrasporangium oryzae NRRL B-24470]
MSLEAPRGRGSDLVEEWGSRPVVATETPFEGIVFDVRRDTVDLGEGGIVVRDYVTHPGAVVVVALHPFDGVDHVLLIRQYRHAAGGQIWELPAGMLDVPGEPPWEAAARELAEEVDLVADRWDLLVDQVASPGVYPEPMRIFLARELRDVDAEEAHERTAEELELRPLWVPLDDAADAVLQGQVSNGAAIVGILGAHAARTREWATLRPRDAAWPSHPAYRGPTP